MMTISHPVFDMRRTFEFKHPTTVFIAGPKIVGKRKFLLRPLKESLFELMSMLPAQWPRTKQVKLSV